MRSTSNGPISPPKRSLLRRTTVALGVLATAFAAVHFVPQEIDHLHSETAATSVLCRVPGISIACATAAPHPNAPPVEKTPPPAPVKPVPSFYVTIPQEGTTPSPVAVNLSLTPVKPGSSTLEATIPLYNVLSNRTQPWTVVGSVESVTGVTKFGTQTSLTNPEVCITASPLTAVDTHAAQLPTVQSSTCLTQGSSQAIITDNHTGPNTGSFGGSATVTISLPPGSPAQSAMVTLDLGVE